jgi:hypothetical protein
MTESPTLQKLEHLDMERQKLLTSTQRYKQALENQVSDIKEGALKFAVQGAIMGGVALGTYFLIKAFRKKEPSQPDSGINSSLPSKTNFTSALFASIQGYIISFLLSLAREKITEYLEEYLLKQNEASPKNQG